MVWEKMHLQEIHYMTLTFHAKCSPVPSTSCYLFSYKSLKLLRQKMDEEIHLQENTLFNLDLGVKITGNVVQYPLHHVTYAAVKFEVATSNS